MERPEVLLCKICEEEVLEWDGWNHAGGHSRRIYDEELTAELFDVFFIPLGRVGKKTYDDPA